MKHVYVEVETWWIGCFRALKIAQKRQVLGRMLLHPFSSILQSSKQHLGQSMAAECYIKGVSDSNVYVCVRCRGLRHDRGWEEGRTGTRMPSAHTTSRNRLRDKSDKDAHTLCSQLNYQLPPHLCKDVVLHWDLSIW